MDAAQGLSLVFMGTSAFAATILEKIVLDGRFHVSAVFAQPDRQAGRGMKIKMPEVKKKALAHGLPIFQPENLRGEHTLELLKDMAPDFIVVAAYGLIIPKNILDIPAIAPINVHASLLPAYRGAAPIQRAIMENPAPDAKTGVSIMKVVPALDAGPVYAASEVAINNMDAAALEEVLAETGSIQLLNVMEKLATDSISPQEQDESRATYAAKLSKSDGIVDWGSLARDVDAKIRGVTPWPGAQTVLNLAGGNTVPVTLLPGIIGAPCAAPPGEMHMDGGKLKIACSDCWYELKRLRPQGKKEMDARDFANGQCKIRNGICGHADCAK